VIFTKLGSQLSSRLKSLIASSTRLKSSKHANSVTLTTLSAVRRECLPASVKESPRTSLTSSANSLKKSSNTEITLRLILRNSLRIATLRTSTISWNSLSQVLSIPRNSTLLRPVSTSNLMRTLRTLLRTRSSNSSIAKTVMTPRLSHAVTTVSFTVSPSAQRSETPPSKRTYLSSTKMTEEIALLLNSSSTKPSSVALQKITPHLCAST